MLFGIVVDRWTSSPSDVSLTGEHLHRLMFRCCSQRVSAAFRDVALELYTSCAAGGVLVSNSAQIDLGTALALHRLSSVAHALYVPAM